MSIYDELEYDLRKRSNKLSSLNYKLNNLDRNANLLRNRIDNKNFIINISSPEWGDVELDGQDSIITYTNENKETNLLNVLLNDIILQKDLVNEEIEKLLSGRKL